MNASVRALRAALLFLVAAGIGFWAWRNFGPVDAGGSADPAGGTPEAAADEPRHQVLVTYFTTDQRCPTCLKIERLTRAAVDSGFADEQARGALRFRTVNFDRPENRHFIDDYELSFKTVVVSERRAGREEGWEKFDDVWTLADRPDAFAAYLREGIRRHLAPDPDD